VVELSDPRTFRSVRAGTLDKFAELDSAIT